MIKGFATKEGTRSHSAQNSSLVYSELDGTGLFASQAGFGCYRTDQTDPEHEKSLRKALLSGINLIDTSSNYGDGGSERLVGTVLQDLIRSGDISRDSVVVVSKVGYLQGQNYEISQERKRQGKPFKELVLYADGLEHCIHPEFIDDQLTRSLKRLKLDTLDFYLLHNPEYYLSWASKTGVSLEEARQEYYGRIEQAFQHLETEVERGRIRFYGISSNTFPSPADDPEFTSLEKVWEIAQSLSPEHHFRLIQLPMNLFETGGITERNQSTGRSVLQFAQEKQIGVLINRPLNAIIANRLIRLAEVEAVQASSPEEISQRMDDLIESEEVLQHEILPELSLTPSLQAQVLEHVALGAVLKQQWSNFGSYERWQELRSYYFAPRIRGVVQFLEQQPSPAESVLQWIRSHQEVLEAAFQAISSIYQEQAAEQAAMIKARVSSADADWDEAATLSQMALRALRSTLGITTVLVGMRQESYVNDVIEELGRPVSTKDRAESWRKLQKMHI
ncbi:MAG: aldo/keto reductase [Deltaproteobacteria bacterium]|nr:aldo/keto reductase [Deltaproteobacteria bacterium]